MQDIIDCFHALFKEYPLYLSMLQDKENGATESELAAKYKCGVDNIQRIRKELIKLFGFKEGTWEIICKEAVRLGLIIQNPKVKKTSCDKPSKYLLDKLEEIEDRKSDKQYKLQNKLWKKKKKKLKYH
jgi:hypothetical protein